MAGAAVDEQALPGSRARQDSALLRPERIRDAERSRSAILGAATQLFAAGGYNGASMSEIGAAAGLSRGAPGYFFGSKQSLYGEVLTAAFGSRQQATEQAFVPVRGWCESDAELGRLPAALAAAAAGYMRFLLEHPEFVALIMREELDGGRRLSRTSRSSTAMQEAFQALRRAGAKRGLRPFEVKEAVLLFVSLTFAPFSYRHTLLRSIDLELASEGGLHRQARLTAGQLMNLLAR
ncbi:MAG: TetR/AcrR family transcriptional regulator [Solirubrobacterales bacterium]